MPIYEYQCEKCGHFEVTQKITENSLKRCPTCKGKVKKLISNTSFQLKGTGWYITDYGRKDRVSTEKKAGKAPVAESKGNGQAEGGSKTAEKPAETQTTKSAGSDAAHP